MSESRWAGWKDRQDGAMALLGLNHENTKGKEEHEKRQKKITILEGFLDFNKTFPKAN